MRFQHIAMVALVSALWVGTADAQELGRVGAICAECHEGVDETRLEALTHAGHLSCMSCHHIGLTNDPEVSQARRVDTCLGCHEDLRDSHVEAKGDRPQCAACHVIHEDPVNVLAPETFSARCTVCHAELDHRLHADVQVDAPECVECHSSHTDKPFLAEDPAVSSVACATCHEETHSYHVDNADDFSCVECHSVKDPLRPQASALQVGACRDCHVNLVPAHEAVEEDAPTCIECHAFGNDASIISSGPQMSQRCGTCHEDAMEGFTAGAHASGLDPEPNSDLPTCVDCHRSHADPGTERANVRLAATVRCIECHSQALMAEKYDLSADVVSSYEDDYHGATVRFMWNHPAQEGQPAVMVCSDCHGAHDVGWKETDLVADVCRECHDGSDDRLASAWIGHGSVGPGNKPMVWLVRLFYFFLIPFMLGGLFLHIAFDLVDKRREGARVMKTEGVQRLIGRLRGRVAPKKEVVTRFSLADRFEHMVSMLSFILLVVTGLPQTRPDLSAANWVIAVFGGIGMTRIVHRVAGFLFVALMALHVARVVMRAIRGRRMPVMVPIRKDFEDALQTLRHYLLGQEKPRVGKFDAAEKFEYWGLFLGAIVMSVTGIVLVFPELVTLLVPGQVVAAIRTMHGLEATFAVMVVVLWHSWGVILRPDVFPLDTSMFTGKMSVERLAHEHPLEYERLFPDRVAPASHEPDGGDPVDLVPSHT